MKKHYKEYFPTSEEDYTNIWKDATIVLDTNILLNLYRYTEDTRDNMFAIMEFYKDKLWMPYQVGLEFLNNRASTTATITKIPETMKVKLDDGKKQLLNVFNNKETSRHPYINKRDLENVYDKAMQQVKEYLEKQAEKTPDYNVSDPILDKVLELYEDKVGENFTPDELLLLYEEGERRYADNIPPGYKDEKEKRGKGRCYLFGDLLIWKQMIAYSLAENKDIIFVTEDKKEDWWDKNHGLRTPRM